MIEYTNSGVSSLIDEYIHSERDRAMLKRICHAGEKNRV